MHSVYIKTLGCKVNTFDSQALEAQFKGQGFEVAEDVELADITVLNTCSVTAAAEKDARYWLRRYSRVNPTSLRVVTGCYAQIDSAALERLEEVDFIVPNEVKADLVRLVRQRFERIEDDQRLPGEDREEIGKMPEGVQSV